MEESFVSVISIISMFSNAFLSLTMTKSCMYLYINPGTFPNPLKSR